MSDYVNPYPFDVKELMNPISKHGVARVIVPHLHHCDSPILPSLRVLMYTYVSCYANNTFEKVYPDNVWELNKDQSINFTSRIVLNNDLGTFWVEKALSHDYQGMFIVELTSYAHTSHRCNTISHLHPFVTSLIGLHAEGKIHKFVR